MLRLSEGLGRIATSPMRCYVERLQLNWIGIVVFGVRSSLAEFIEHLWRSSRMRRDDLEYVASHRWIWIRQRCVKQMRDLFLIQFLAKPVQEPAISPVFSASRRFAVAMLCCELSDLVLEEPR